MIKEEKKEYKIPDLPYFKEHTWVRAIGSRGRIGITDYAQKSLGEITWVELPEVGTDVKQGEPFGSIESRKAVSDLYAPVTGSVTEVNGRLASDPETINRSPYDAGWMIIVQIKDLDELKNLMNADGYRALIGGK